MSFFFTKKKPRAETAKSARGAFSGGATASMKRSAPTLNRLGCSACPLNKADVQTPKMQPTLAKETLVYFLAEAPGRHEDEESGHPLTGPSGSLLRECIPDGDEEYCSFDNVVRDRPPKNRTPDWAEMECCRGHVTKSIEQAKPKLIVGLGLIPLRWMLNSTDMAGMRGRLFAVKIGSHSCWFMPTYHPSFILHVAFDKRKPLNSKMGHCFRMDLRRAFDVVGKLKTPIIYTEAQIRANIECFDGSNPGKQLPRLLSLLQVATAAPIKAVDLETKGLRPFSTGGAIMTAAVSCGNLNFSFALNHPKAGWSSVHYNAIVKAFKLLLKDSRSTKVAHNLPFEMEWFIWLYGKEIADHESWDCTQMQAHFLDERRGKQSRNEEDDQHRAVYQSLDFLVKQHFGVAYKSFFKLNKKDMSKSDLGETLIYNGADTKLTLRLFKWQDRLLREQKLQDAYLDALPRQVTVALMQTFGVATDQTVVKQSKKRLEGEIATVEKEINELKVVKAYITDHKVFNPLGDDALILFRDYLKRPEIVVAPQPHEVHDFNISSTTKKKFDKRQLEGKLPTKYSLDKNVLDQIDHPLAGLIIKLRNRSKLKSTYVDILEQGVGEQIYPDGLIHTNFNTTFAETGRTSSDGPNLQNFPQRNDSWVRKQIRAEPGNVLVAFDYGQLEACTAAMCSNDKILVKSLWDDYDIHAEWAHKLYKKYPLILGSRQSIDNPKDFKKLRSYVKNKLVFPAIFGAQNKSIAGYLNTPEDKIDDLMDEFWGTFRGLKKWQDGLMKRYYDTGSVESYVGRAHRYPLTRNQAINHPVQCLAAEIVCEAMNRLSIKAVIENKWHLHPRLNIHDDLTFSIPDKDSIIEDSITQIYKIMLSPTYQCLNVPLSVSASIGTHWYGMTEIGKFWSHKDL